MKILFICSANICRSPLAETILKAMINARGLKGVEVESAGILHREEGMPRDYRMALYAHEAGYDLGGYARCVDGLMLDSYDYIICMEFYHVVEIQKRVQYQNWGHIHLFNEICFGENTDVIDPTGDIDYFYQHVCNCIESGCKALIAKLEKYFYLKL